jgi:Tol biopolymer transport system component
MRFPLRTLVAVLLALGAVGAGASPAAAEFGPIRLVSRSAVQQAGEAVAPAISADGRYLAFQGTIGGEKGVFRKDLQSGAVQPVLAGSAYEANAPGSDATAPSISADGRYVAFTTAVQLDPGDDVQPGSRDVYVADMASSPPGYVLASALDGSPAGLTYGAAGGSEATGRVALSADGRTVAFFTTATSNLTGDPTKTETPAGQIAVRDLDSRRTTLVSAERDPETGAMTARPVTGGALVPAEFNMPLLRGAALSADGTTVAWPAAHLPAQVPLPVGEGKTISELDEKGQFPYVEPLWRRIGDGSGAPTRRIVAGEGAAELLPLLTQKNTGFNVVEGWLGLRNVDGIPQLSADGRTVALIGNPTLPANLFLVEMGDGTGGGQAIRPLTEEISLGPGEEVNSKGTIPLDGHLFDLAISADGWRIAFATARQRFPLAPPNLIGAPPSRLGMVELYLLDRDGETLRRVTHGFSGESEPSLAPAGSNLSVSNGAGAGSPSFGGDLIAFGSIASNLVPGDGNDAGDAFTVADDEAPRVAGATSIAPAPSQRRRRPRWRLRLSAFSLPDGGVRLVAVVPAAGAVHAGVAAEIGQSGGSRRLDGARARSRHSGPVPLILELPARLRDLAHSREGVYAMARVSFRGRGHRILRGWLQVRFHAHPAKHKRGRP